MLAATYHIIENEYYWLLLETNQYRLQFKINNELTLRGLLGNTKFKNLTSQVAFASRSYDYKVSMVLLDKIKDSKAVIELMITLYEERAKPEYFCSAQLNGMPEAYKIGQRPMDEFSKIVDDLKKQKANETYKDLFDMLTQLDATYKAFDMLALAPEKITREVMSSCLQQLQVLSYLPKEITTFERQPKPLQDITPAVLMCASKLCLYSGRVIRNQYSNTLVTKPEDQKAL